ncbi:2,3-diaminopropionate biosynthesis protein SbnA [Glycomyces sp. TRM65418]|uniref:2,3-diaminopropionate biosynthesis protein SbnA n=1 Tax=Glycomyces sp. TRM65418 TaxID=2867006 RepID=UPI001CE505CE|nr:2,3-diaminopropionate biosynthesis protein SbnA [Glycomyces sp. TRM65418]MCC3761580.1 2,3-diaminopropionate biosynthesis protein SbnA [Glycomyces sp. TRM65418]QZD55675.1 2,3-diaminopropionate biosynthesis protein SbnA [Glycomyces sp. TRM65418]
MIFQEAFDIVSDDIFLELRHYVPGSTVYLKLEGLNPAGSIKIKPAIAMVEEAEKQGRLRENSRVIESSSGNLGIALSTVCAAKGYRLTIVTDANTQEPALRAMAALGTELVVIDRPDARGGFLHQRIEYITAALRDDPELVWLNQYASPANPRAHTETTARSLHEHLGDIDVLVVGTGTSGTLMGCLEYRRRYGLRHRVVAVDAVGSVTFGGPPRRRYIPGLGASRRPEVYTDAEDFEKLLVEEADTVAECRAVARRYGLLVGGSTGSVLFAVRRIGAELPHGSRIAAISPDLGEKYLSTVYSDEWVASHPTLQTNNGAVHV